MKNLPAAVLIFVGAAFSVAAAPTGAAAQFTAALIPPPAPVQVDTAAQADSTRTAAKALEERMTNIKEWVDSAAAALAAQPAAVPPVPPDTARMPPKIPAIPDSSRAPTNPPDTSALRSRRPPG